VSWHGEQAWNFDRNRPFLTFGLMYSEPAADFDVPEDCFIYFACNAHWEEHRFELPVIPEGMSWRIVLSSADEKTGEAGREVGNTVVLMPRSSMILLGKKWNG
jgi:glycogen operon protein